MLRDRLFYSADGRFDRPWLADKQAVAKHGNSAMRFSMAPVENGAVSRGLMESKQEAARLSWKTPTYSEKVVATTLIAS